jgi:hypothetical protein
MPLSVDKPLHHRIRLDDIALPGLIGTTIVLRFSFLPLLSSVSPRVPWIPRDKPRAHNDRPENNFLIRTRTGCRIENNDKRRF